MSYNFQDITPATRAALMQNTSTLSSLYRQVMSLDGKTQQLFKGEQLYNNCSPYGTNTAFRLRDEDGVNQEIDFTKCSESGADQVANNAELNRVDGLTQSYCSPILDVIEAGENMKLLGVYEDITYVQFTYVTDLASGVQSLKDPTEWGECDDWLKMETLDLLACTRALFLDEQETADEVLAHFGLRDMPEDSE